LHLDRSAVAFKAGIAGISMVTLSGGTLPYAASFVDLPAPKGISFSLSREVLMVSATGDTEAGNSTQVKVADSAGSTAFLTISVEDKTASATTGTTNKSTSAKKESSSFGCRLYWPAKSIGGRAMPDPECDRRQGYRLVQGKILSGFPVESAYPEIRRTDQ
jgi:hypothetical protein